LWGGRGRVNIDDGDGPTVPHNAFWGTYLAHCFLWEKKLGHLEKADCGRACIIEAF